MSGWADTITINVAYRFFAVAAAHGLNVSRVDGSALRYNQPDVYMPDLLICRPEWTQKVLQLVG